MFIYVSLALIAITALIVIVNLLKGLLRGLKKTIGTLIAIILSAVIAAIITFIICDPNSSLMMSLMDLLKGVLSNGDFQDILGIEELTESLSYYISMIAAPFVFMALYTLLSIILSIVVAILVKIIPPHKKPKMLIHRLGGLGVGLVCGLLVAALILMPIVGILNVIIPIGNSNLIQSEELEDNVPDELRDFFKEASEDKIFALYAATSGWMFDSFASVAYDGERIYLKDEINVIASVIGNIMTISGDVSDFGDEQVEALDNVVTDLDRSPMLKNTLAGVLSHVASKWVAGETFVGMERIDAGELVNPVIDSVLEVLATSTKENITADMTTLVDIIEVMVDYKILENIDDFEKMLSVLSEVPEEEGKESAIEALLNVANANPRMKGLADEVTQLSIRALASTLGIPVDHDDRYNMLMDDIAATLNESVNAEDRKAYVKENVTDALSTYGVTISGDAADDITDSILADLGSYRDLNGDAVKEFFMMYAVASGSMNETNSGIYGFDMLASGSGALSTDSATGEIKLGDYVFKYYNANSYTDSAAYKAGSAHVDFGAADTLYSSESMSSTLITLEDIFNAGGEGEKSKKFSELTTEEARAEAKKFSELLKLVGDLFGDDFENINYRQMIKDMGAVLDKMAEMQTLGDAATAELVKAVFQSEALANSIGLPKDQLEQRALDIINNARRDDSSYANATKVIGGMLDMIDKVNDKNATKEEKIETTKELMANMNPANAEMLSNMATPEMMKDYVKDEEKAEKVSNSVSTLFDNMANFDAKDEEEYHKEAEAVNTVLNLALEGTESENAAIFSELDDDGNVVTPGKLDTDAEGFITLITESKVMSQTIRETAETEENPYGVEPTAEDEEKLSAALVDHYENEKENLNAEQLAELKVTLESIAMISNIEIPEFN